MGYKIEPMKTPLQDLLKLESDLTNMFDSDQRVAMAILEHIRSNRNDMLEKENRMIIGYAYEINGHMNYDEIESDFNAKFNTNEK